MAPQKDPSSPKQKRNGDSNSKKKDVKKIKFMTRKQANALVIDSGVAIQKALEHLEAARALAQRAGLSVDASIVPRVDPNQPGTLVDTGGHSNTDHVVLRTGDERKDRIAELKRNLLRRYRSMQPENRGEDRWDQPKILGGRRRRIVREKDLPEAPPEPPPTGYVVFVGQMTTKIRHDRPNVPHDQAKVVQEISKIWKIGMSALDRAYYNTFAIDAKREYEQQVVEYRATGSFTPSTEFGKLEGVNVWVRRKFQNGLEREISAYSTCLFPKRPKEMDEAYEKREERSKLKRKLKLKGLLNDDGSLKKGLDFEVLLEEERAKERTKRVGTEDSSITATMNNEQQIGNDRNETDRAGK